MPTELTDPEGVLQQLVKLERCRRRQEVLLAELRRQCHRAQAIKAGATTQSDYEHFVKDAEARFWKAVREETST